MMITKKFMLGVCVCAAPTVAYVSCDSKLEENAMMEKKNECDNSLRTNVSNFLACHDSISLVNLHSYMLYGNCVQETRSSVGANTFFDMYAYELFLQERGLTEDDMEVYFEENPDEMDYLVKKVCTPTFCAYYNRTSCLHTEELIMDFYVSVSNSPSLSNLEKVMLCLLAESEMLNTNPQTRSFSGCVKRYAKLTSISVKSLRISLIDFQSGVEYATRELKGMGDKYNDC